MCRKLIYLICFVFVMVFAFVGTAQAALLKDGGFEDGFNQWAQINGGTGVWHWNSGVADINTADKYEGLKSADFRVAGTGGAGVFQEVLVGAGVPVSISAYAKIVSGTGGSGGIDMVFFNNVPPENTQNPANIGRVNLQLNGTIARPADNGPVYTGPYAGSWGPIDANGWRYGTLSAVTPAGTVCMKYEVNANNNVGRFLFDNVVGTPLPLIASNPYPADKSAYDGINVTLTWDPGRYAATTDGHHVYFGTVLSDVNQGINNTDKGSRIPPNYPVTTSLTPGTTYYWRIDEVNDACSPPSPWKGSVWRFTVNPLTAYNPSPLNGDKLVDPNANLSWSKGMRAVTHKVYFSSNFNDVNERKPAAGPVIRTDPNYIIGPLLAFDKIYYWAVDEVNVTTWPGPVWSFKTWPNTPITDPNLVGWWKFDLDDNSGGSKTFDSSGHNRHGTLHSSPAYTTGISGDAINLDGIDDWVSVGSVGISGAAPRTIAGWAKMNTTPIPGGTNVFGFAAGVNSSLFNIAMSASGGYVIHIYFWEQPIIGPDLEWHHFAATYDGTTIFWYCDGQLVNVNGAVPPTLTTTDDVRMGESTINENNFFPGLIDDVRIYNKALTEAEIGQIMASTSAYKPYPADGEPNVPRQLTLTWEPGLEANSVKGHELYFSSNFNDVNERTAAKIVRSVPSYGPIGPLNLDQTYYWRVDEVNNAGPDPCFWPGKVWSFTVVNYIVVDDFDSYECTSKSLCGDKALRAVWTAASGAVVSLQIGNTDANLVHDGNSMKYDYDNYYQWYSEAYANTTGLNSLPSGIGSNWNVGGVKALSLWFYGQAGNDANEQMYVKLTDGGLPAKTAKVPYPIGDMNDIRDANWHEWNIALTEFAGVNLANVARITIGFGDGNDPYPAPNPAGTVYFDDIRLYIPRCMPGTVPDSASGNCLIDYPDLLILTNNWLISEYDVVPVEPNNNNLIGWWKLDEGAGTIAADSSIYDNDGNLAGDPNSHPQWVAGHIGSALDFNGVTDYVDCSNDVSLNEPNITGKITLAAWVKTDDCGNSQWNPYITKGDFAYTLQQRSPAGTGINELEIAIYGTGTTWYFASTPVDSSFNGVWHHLAGTYNGSQVKLYVDGELNAITDYVGPIATSTANVNLGKSSDFTDRWYNGLLDDVRIYSRALSQGEVAYLAERSTFTQPLEPLLTPPSPGINLYKDGTIDLRDYAALASKWLEEVLWPAVP